MRSIVYALCFVVLWLGSAAAEAVPLYKGYVFGMPRADIAKVAGVGECADTSLGDALCADGQVFAGQEWLQIFVFNAGKLDRVALVATEIDQHYSAAMGAVVNNKFSLVAIHTPQNIFDMFAEVRRRGGDIVAGVTEFEMQGLRAGKITCTL